MILKKCIILIVTALVVIAFMASGCGDEKSTEPKTDQPNGTVPTVSTTSVDNITQNSADGGGNVTSEGSTSVTSKGVCWSTNTTPTIAHNTTNDGSGPGSFTSTLTGLAENTIYYARAYATNSVGTGYGSTVSFTTKGTVVDIDGNIYLTIPIGTQVWMAENLKVTHYRNGDPIPNVTNGQTWSGLSSGAYCAYNNSSGNIDTYGLLYNWHAVSDNRNIAPDGWHVPTDGDWQTLITYLGGQATAGGKLKETGTAHWSTPNTGATNSSGFLALPAGRRVDFPVGIDGFTGLEAIAGFWSSSYPDDFYGWSRILYYDSEGAVRDNRPRFEGLSVRCVKD